MVKSVLLLLLVFSGSIEMIRTVENSFAKRLGHRQPFFVVINSEIRQRPAGSSHVHFPADAHHTAALFDGLNERQGIFLFAIVNLP